jgi:hypothetical protein
MMLGIAWLFESAFDAAMEAIGTLRVFRTPPNAFQARANANTSQIGNMIKAVVRRATCVNNLSTVALIVSWPPYLTVLFPCKRARSSPLWH